MYLAGDTERPPEPIDDPPFQKYGGGVAIFVGIALSMLVTTFYNTDKSHSARVQSFSPWGPSRNFEIRPTGWTEVEKSDSDKRFEVVPEVSALLEHAGDPQPRYKLSKKFTKVEAGGKKMDVREAISDELSKYRHNPGVLVQHTSTKDETPRYYKAEFHLYNRILWAVGIAVLMFALPAMVCVTELIPFGPLVALAIFAVMHLVIIEYGIAAKVSEEHRRPLEARKKGGKSTYYWMCALLGMTIPCLGLIAGMFQNTPPAVKTAAFYAVAVGLPVAVLALVIAIFVTGKTGSKKASAQNEEAPSDKTAPAPSDMAPRAPVVAPERPKSNSLGRKRKTPAPPQMTNEADKFTNRYLPSING